MRIPLTVLLISSLPVLADPVVIGHQGLPPLDAKTLERIYTGKIVELSGMRLTPVNLPPRNPLRERFLQVYLGQDEAKYTGYWTVRRYIGKGTPPRELRTPHEIVQFVAQAAGAIGYVDEADVSPETLVLLRRAP